MKKLPVLIVLIIVLLACGTVAYAQSPEPSTSLSSAVATRSGDVLSVPSGSAVPQPAQPPKGAMDAQIAQYVIYAIAIAVVVILLVVFRRRFKKGRDDE